MAQSEGVRDLPAIPPIDDDGAHQVHVPRDRLPQPRAELDEAPCSVGDRIGNGVLRLVVSADERSVLLQLQDAHRSHDALGVEDEGAGDTAAGGEVQPSRAGGESLDDVRR